MVDNHAARTCPFCGYDDRDPAEINVLNPRTVLKRKYLIGRVLGQGGFGITYLGCDLEKFEKLAIKEYFPRVISSRARDRLSVTPSSGSNRDELVQGVTKFAEEAQSLSRFRDHPGVVPFLDFFPANGTAYIVMRYLEGCDLKQYLRDRGGTLPFPATLEILTPVMSALDDLHQLHILHRDISPDNIYVERSGRVRILDFGATRYAMGEQSQTFSTILKHGYAPEEQYRSHGRQGPYTDIYALGATFYRCITGQIPPPAMDRLNLDELTPPRKLGVAMPARSEEALLKSLAVKAENRFQKMAEFRGAITPYNIDPPKPPPVNRSQRLPISISAVALLLLSLFFISNTLLQIVDGLSVAVLLVFVIVPELLSEQRRSQRRQEKFVSPVPLPQHRYILFCTAGEYAGESIDLGHDSIIIGRDPSKANLVIPSDKVSAKHAAILKDATGEGFWVEDLHSRNHTYYKPANGQEWFELTGRKLLSAGDRFRLSQGEAEFEIRAA
jgi:serine/threonine protein kinase